MGRKILCILGAATALVLPGCGMNGGTQNASSVSFDSSVPDYQAAAINDDLIMLSGSNFDSYAQSIASQTTQALGTGSLSGAELSSWFAQRVRVVLGDSYNWKTAYNVSAVATTPPRQYESVTLMFNVGGYLYLQGAVSTPRVGLVQIGEGMFTANQVQSSSIEAQVNRYLRLAVMFHEARHSDGNGQDATFPHALCKSGSYRGKYACDAYSNGPYVVQAYLNATFAYACTQCTQSEYQSLLGYIGDYASRLQPGARYADPTPVF